MVSASVENFCVFSQIQQEVKNFEEKIRKVFGDENSWLGHFPRDKKRAARFVYLLRLLSAVWYATDIRRQPLTEDV